MAALLLWGCKSQIIKYKVITDKMTITGVGIMSFTLTDLSNTLITYFKLAKGASIK